jgi:3-hydroxybutyrate dehydrogenase
MLTCHSTVGTPLFTEHPEAAAFLDMEKDHLLPPIEVAKAMFAIVTETKYQSGNWREVSLLNDPGPSGPASKTSKKHEAIQQILKFLQPEGSNGTSNLNGVGKSGSIGD